MLRYIAKRLIMIVPILVGVTLLIFFILALTPGDPANIALGPAASEKELELFRQQTGLDKPLFVQYVNYMAKAVTGDFGVSYHNRQTVGSMISARVGNTLFLSFTSMALTIIVALILGIAMAIKQNSFFDNFMRVFTVVLTSMPQFWLALMMILLFSVKLRWLPSAGLFRNPGDSIMPIFCLAGGAITMCARTGRSSMLEVINQDYIRTARAKGLKRGYIIRRHALKNSLLPMVSVYGRIIGTCFSGSVVIESVFGINGIGNMMTEALRGKDVPAIMGSVIITACVVTVVNLLTDLTYAFIDPRIKSLYMRRKSKPKAAGAGETPVISSAGAPGAETDLNAIEQIARRGVGFSASVEVSESARGEEIRGEEIRGEEMRVDGAGAPGVPVNETPQGARTFSARLVGSDVHSDASDSSKNRIARGAYKRHSLWMDVWKRMRKNKTAVVGMIVFMVMLLACLASPLIYSYRNDVIAVDIANQLQGPSGEYILGADELGRDILARILWGGRTTLLVSFCALIVAFTLGAVLGTIAAYYGSVADTLIMRFVDIVMSIPPIMLMITLATVMTPSTLSLIFVVGLSLVPGQARMIRGQVLQVVDKEFIEAVRIQGAGDLKIILLHILPNAISPIITTVILDIAFAVVIISTLSFLGLGVQPPAPEWGSMLAGGRQYLRYAAHITTFPGVALLITLLSLTLVGDGMRDALDPRMKR